MPYLGIRYSFPENPSFKLNEMSIYMDGFKIQDVLKNSHGILNGQINVLSGRRYGAVAAHLL